MISFFTSSQLQKKRKKDHCILHLLHQFWNHNVSFYNPKYNFANSEDFFFQAKARSKIKLSFVNNLSLAKPIKIKARHRPGEKLFTIDFCFEVFDLKPIYHFFSIIKFSASWQRSYSAWINSFCVQTSVILTGRNEDCLY